jgi:plasmid stability protein
MATLHIRQVPAEVVDVLKARAERAGRSLNSEVVETLSDAARRSKVDEILANIDRIRAGITNPPSGEQIDRWIREGREQRSEQVWRAATRRRDE